jgi:pyruvate carboxylase
MTKSEPIRKLLAAIRSEFAIRIFRAANELGLRLVMIAS